MKRRIISGVSICLVLVLAWLCFAQEETPATKRSEETRSRWQQWRERQQKSLSQIEAQVTKMKTMMESSSGGRQRWRDASEEERTKLREEYRKMREDRTKALGTIEDQILLLKGRRTVYQEYDDSMDELKGLLELAKKEKAKETTAAIEKLIADKKKEFEKKVEELGIGERPRQRRGN
jgi:hypothetical protein